MGAPVRVVPKSQTPLDRMIEAVGVEIKSVQRQSLGDIVVVTDGVRTAHERAGATYVFTCGSASLPRDDDRIVGDFDRNRVEGYVVSAARVRFVVALAADLGPTIQIGRLMADKTFLWTSLRVTPPPSRLAARRYSSAALFVFAAACGEHSRRAMPRQGALRDGHRRLRRHPRARLSASVAVPAAGFEPSLAIIRLLPQRPAHCAATSPGSGSSAPATR